MTWLKKADKAVFEALCACFGLDPASSAAGKRFRAAYLEEATSPQSGRKDNLCYYALSESPNSSLDALFSRYEDNAVTVRKVVPIQCLFTFYGPDADEDAEKVWSRLFIDLGQGCPRSILRQAGMVPLPRPSHPNAAPELEGSLWRRRTDLTVYFSMLEEETIAVPQVEQPGGMDVRQK